jgi:hypothetical protein
LSFYLKPTTNNSPPYFEGGVASQSTPGGAGVQLENRHFDSPQAERNLPESVLKPENKLKPNKLLFLLSGLVQPPPPR